ncbi:hypothetical protein Slin15195_G038960 [Septoria linicola]|uniref:Uncharacterized protein n=1 Tax=Septoria linicola TaxID=215465 RepID=A0A9Q9AR71_9PEZI|nr:hypothetical protein Slin14017_G120370 [Septoria linicola]USW50577.1 hypothetical protein Slin15195_G038960 [Septoria linicola]
MVRVVVNEEKDNDWDYEGSVGIVWAFDAFDSVLGSSDIKPKGRIKAGGKADIEIHQFLGSTRDAQYIDIIASDDEICISYIQVSSFDDNKAPYVWLGDVGRACGQSWEYGTKSVTGGDSAAYNPSCVWMDQDHGEDINKKLQTDTITNRQMKINLLSYSGIGAKNGTVLTDLDHICGSTIFSYDMDDPIEGRTPRGPYYADNGKFMPDNGNANKKRAAEATSISPRSRKARPQSAKMAERLWVNSRHGQSAIELCNSPTSRGSDFVSVDEGVFCDMSTKTLHPLCSAKKTVGCFDLDADKLQLHRRGGAKLQQRGKSVRQYKKISYAD